MFQAKVTALSTNSLYNDSFQSSISVTCKDVVTTDR